MSDTAWELAADIFADAVDLPRDARARFIAERCGERSRLRTIVERLLAAHDAADPAFMRELDVQTIRTVIESAGDALDGVGPYRFVREIASGGMGQVFLAERRDGQFDQQVAVKLLKRGMDSDAILARFLRERQIVAGLEHPNIARLIDGGIAEDGRPYFVMEYVAGLPITQYCDERRLTIDERLDLFSTVCRAVEYAHRRLIVHRDLKPSNILVTQDGQPKLLDFGIARVLAADDPDADAEPLTIGMTMLTPEYAAPEQLREESVTTAADVYSAGAVLYELLCGRRPFARLDAVARIQGSDAAVPPLSRAPREPAEAAAIAAARRTDSVRLRRQLAGDLETIVATALQTAAERRYASAEALREDIRRHRQHLPVRARPDTAIYKCTRFVRRHRISVLATGVAAILIVAFGITAGVQAHRIQRQSVELSLERDRAQREAEATQSVSDFLVGVFEVADPLLEARGDTIRAADLLDRGARQIDAELSGQPEIQARMLAVIGRAYDNLLQSDRAEPLVQRALALQRTIHGDDSEPVVEALQQLAGVLSRRGDLAGAEAALGEAIAIQERRGAGLETNDPRTWSLLVDLTGVMHGTGDHRQAADLTAQAVAVFDRMPVESFSASRPALARLAQLLSFSSGQAERAERVYARLVDVQSAATGPHSAAVADIYSDWGRVRHRRGEIDAADSLFSLAMTIQEDIDVASVPVAQTLRSLADIAFTRRQYERSDSLYRRAIAILRAQLGDDHRTVALTLTPLAESLGRRGHFEEAIELHRRAIGTYIRLGEEATVHLWPSRWRLGVALHGAGRLHEAITEYESSLRGLTSDFPPDYILTANVRRDYGLALVELGRYAEAEAMLLPAIDVLAARWGDDDFRADLARITLGRALEGLGRTDEARAVLAAVVDRLQGTRGPQDSIAVRARETLSSLAR
ncbi:MAG TPA: serine/threonine-protein kinase [Longimicrobiales bacterium]|nr:serine/threonine-protein kinase [Longimicrobiales bacterium]